MQQDILRRPNIKKIVLKYKDGKNVSRVETVLLRFIDKKTCFFTGRVLADLAKPKWRARAIISVYTTDGIFNSEVIIRGVEYSFSEITYELDIPKVWNFGQLRAGIRKSIALPVTLTFSDGFVINSKTVDLSVGGFSFATAEVLSSFHSKFECDCKISFSPDLGANFPDGVLEGNAIFVRERVVNDYDNLRNARVLCFKFKNLSTDKILILKNFLMKLGV